MHAAALTGPVANGKEFTLYVSHGPLLIRVTAVAPTGIPFINVLTVAKSILATPLPEIQSRLDQGAALYLPSALPLAHGSCFGVFDEGTYVYSDVAAWFEQAGESTTQFEAWGWQSGAYRVFRCEAPPPGGASQIDVGEPSVFDSAFAAQEAAAYSASGYVTDANEARLCDSGGSVLVCVTGRAPAGPPTTTRYLPQQVLVAAGGAPSA